MRRLQSEAQLVFYTQAVNEAREQRGALAVNSFWLSGCGRLQPAPASSTPEIATGLRAPLLAGDWAAWADAWHALDDGAVARLLERARDGDAARRSPCAASVSRHASSRSRAALADAARRGPQAPGADVLAAL